MEWADAALYWVKQNGRNGWALLQPSGDVSLASLVPRAREGARSLIEDGTVVAITA